MEVIFTLEEIIKMIFPPKCIFCGSILGIRQQVEICEPCLAKVPFIRGDTAMAGARILKNSYFDKVICLCRYWGIIKQSLIRYKFFNKSGYYRTFAKLLSDEVKRMTNLEKFDIIISVPLHQSKQHIRGYNQSLLLTRELSRQIGIVESSGIMSRTKRTNAQSLLPRDGRYLNVKDAFRLNDAIKIRNKVILLVDDILTTGYTVNECSRLLKEAGAKEVVVAVIASGNIS